MLKKALLYITLSTGLAVTGVVWTGSEDVARTKEDVDEFSQSIDALVKERSLLEAEIAELEDDKTFLYQWIDELMKEKTKNLALQIMQDKYVGAIYRPLEQVLSMVKCCAVLRDSKKVEEQDINKILGLSVWINRSQNQL